MSDEAWCADQAECIFEAGLMKRDVQIKEPMTLLGTSLGGAVALDFALAHPEAVSNLVLVNAQGFADGLGSMTLMPQFVAKFGVQVCAP